MILDESHIPISVVIWGIILGVKNGAGFANGTLKDITPRSGVVLVAFNGNGFLKLFYAFCLSHVGLILARRFE